MGIRKIPGLSRSEIHPELKEGKYPVAGRNIKA
jgi:hypothetical protein